LVITPRHPVFIQGNWFKPDELAVPKLRKCHVVYNFVLETGHSMEINDICCATLGHGFKEPKVHHDYFGTEKVLFDLQKSKTYQQGFVDLKIDHFVRDPQSDKICAISQTN